MSAVAAGNVSVAVSAVYADVAGLVYMCCCLLLSMIVQCSCYELLP